MNADIIPVIAGLLIVLASLISLRTGLSVAIIEILLGAIAGNLGFHASLFGYNAGYINQVQYSILIGVVIASAVIPTFIAQQWFMPKHTEDIETEEMEVF